MSNYTEIHMRLLEQQRNAYVPAYITYCVPDTTVNGIPLNDTIKTANDLFEYLLIDTENSSQVDTTWIEETITSLQTYINGCLSGYEPEVDNAKGSTMVEQSRSGGFLDDWNEYNQAYSTWSGKERLQFYASNYIEPGLRQNKTTLFQALEQSITQGKIRADRVEQAFTNYLTSFETLANLETISGYLAGDTPNVSSGDSLYFVGRTQNTPRDYYLRSCDMSVRNDRSEITAQAWTEWTKISAPISDAIDSFVSVAWFNNRCHVCWISSTVAGELGKPEEVRYSYTINIYYLNPNGEWVSFRKIPLESIAEGTRDPRRAWCAECIDRDGYALFIECGNPSGLESDPLVLIVVMDDEILLSTKNKYLASNMPPGFIFCDIGVPAAPPGHQLAQVGDKFFIKSTLCTIEAVTYDTGDSMNVATTLPGSDLSYSRYAKDGQHQTPPATSVPYPPSPYKVGFFYGSLRAAYIKFINSDDQNLCFYTRVEDMIGVGEEDITDFLNEYFAAPYFTFDPWVLAFKGRSHSSDAVLAQISTNSGPFFYGTLERDGIPGLLSYATQEEKIEMPLGSAGAAAPINFNSAYGLYFWEIFFYVPFLIADRYLIEQDYDNSALWYQYIFSAAGYRNADGQLETVEPENQVRYWNVVPLQQDLAWDEVIPPTDDPNMIAMNDPMQFKMAIFLKTVDMLMQSGDHYYRQLERDRLAKAKLYYLQASQLLGPRPQIDYNNSWPNPTLAQEAQRVVVVDSDNPDAASATYLTQALRIYLDSQNGSFLPPYNEDLLRYWDQLEVRFYNLRHNLSLNGQPLALPMYASPISPAELQLRNGAGNGPGSDTMRLPPLISQFRFSVLLDQARAAAINVTQFGTTLLNTLEKNDNESMTLLLQLQQKNVLEQTQGIQNINLTIQKDTLTALQEAKSGADERVTHYKGLCENWISSTESTAMDLESAATAAYYGSIPLMSISAVIACFPTIFGLADGGAQPSSAAGAAAFGFQSTGQAMQSTAGRLGMSSEYQRRLEEWQIQLNNAKAESQQIEAQIAAQTQQISMARKQVALNDLQRQNQEAVYNLQRTSFTGKALYSWMTGRLSALYYQLYDVTLELCLTAASALAREIGEDKTRNLFAAPLWNDLYQGLLAGEGLILELQRMENTYLLYDRRGLEIQKTVSLNTLLVTANPVDSLSSLITQAFAAPGSTKPSPLGTSGVSMVYTVADGILKMTLDIAKLNLSKACNSNDKTGRFYGISVTLPALLGPYQDVEATLDMQGTGSSIPGTTIALSRGLDDTGMFVSDTFNFAKYLPFEGLSTDKGTLVLSFYLVGPGGQQRALVESLTDVIYQLRYTLKDS